MTDTADVEAAREITGRMDVSHGLRLHLGNSVVNHLEKAIAAALAKARAEERGLSDGLAFVLERLIRHARAVREGEREIIQCLGGKPPKQISVDILSAESALKAYRALKGGPDEQ